MFEASLHITRLIAALVEARAGLHYRALDLPLFSQKLDDHLAETGFDSLPDFYYHLRYDDGANAAIDRLIDALLVHETYFFREIAPLSVAIERFVLPVIAGGRRARVWSAAASTGEEPLSIAILLAEHGVLDQCEIVASDISERALERARAGRYRGRSLRGDGQALADRWLERRDGEIHAPQRLRDAIDYRQLNLCDDEGIVALGRFDLIACRNVLIYFDDTTIARILSSISRRLHPGGALLVGVTESLLRFSTQLRCEEVDRVFVYRRES